MRSINKRYRPRWMNMLTDAECVGYIRMAMYHSHRLRVIKRFEDRLPMLSDPVIVISKIHPYPVLSVIIESDAAGH